MTRPRWKNEFNLNTGLLIVGLLVTGAGWGVIWQSMRSGQDANAREIVRLRSDVDSLQSDNRALGNLRFRVDTLETGANTAAQSTRALEASVNEVKSDIRVIREIVERLDANGARRSLP